MSTAEAIREYETACEHDRNGREHEAVPHYERALELGLDDERAGAMLGLGSTYRNVGRIDDSVALLRQAVTDYPDDQALKVFLALSLHTAGLTGEGLALAIEVALHHPEVSVYRPPLEFYAEDIARRASHFKHVCYRVGDIERSLAYYGALGFQERRRYQISDGETKVMLGLERDGELLGLTFLDGVDSYDLGTGYNHIALTVTDMAATFAALEPHGLDIEQEPFSKRPGGSKIAFVRDPDGYRIELVEKS